MAAAIVELEEQDLGQMLAGKKVVLVFWVWCAPYRRMNRDLGLVAKQLPDTIQVIMVNIEDHKHAATKYKIRAIPTVVILDDGEQKDTFIGEKPEGELLDRIKKAFDLTE
ncbi:MAG: thioredoxin family protein [Candidatus Berkelbacteria bacterium]|nr:thioredoxin family protein [Candidatus Berkelbacteria bacterium]